MFKRILELLFGRDWRYVKVAPHFTTQRNPRPFDTVCWPHLMPTGRFIDSRR